MLQANVFVLLSVCPCFLLCRVLCIGPGMTKVFRAGIAFVSCSTLTTVSERCDTGASDFA